MVLLNVKQKFWGFFVVFFVTVTSFGEQPCLKNKRLLESVRDIFTISQKRKTLALARQCRCRPLFPEDEDRQLLFIRAELETLVTHPPSRETWAASQRWAQLSRHPLGQDSLMAGAGWGQVTGWPSLLITRLPCNPSTGGRTRPLNFRAPESRWRDRRLLQV